MKIAQQKSYARDVVLIPSIRPTLVTTHSRSGTKSKSNIKTVVSRVQELIPYQPPPNCKRSKCKQDIYYPHSKKQKWTKSPTSNIHHLSSRSKLPIWKRHFTTATRCQYDAFDEMQHTIPSFFQLHRSTETEVKTEAKSRSDPKKQRLTSDTIIIRMCEFFLFCHERQQIWYNRRKRKLSRELWTQDELLATKHFTNLYRELDAGTIYFQQHILELRKEYYETSLIQMLNVPVTTKTFSSVIKSQRVNFEEEVLWAAVCYRLLNRIETFKKLGGIPKINEWKRFQRKLSILYNEGKHSIFTGAHQNVGHRRYIETLESLQENNCALLHGIMHQIKNASAAGDLECCTKAVQRIINVGQFFAWQITCDIMECNLMGNIEVDWVQLGPGAGVSFAFVLLSSGLSNSHHPSHAFQPYRQILPPT